jgi:PAS domain S-box-containing protein
MRRARLPDEEGERLQALRAAGILDTPPEADFDALTRIAATICGTPIALVSMLDAHREWFKSRVGLATAELPRDVSLSAHAILEPDLLVVPDTHKDDRFSDNPLVLHDPNIRFYAATPLRTVQGYAFGVLCVIDHVPRQLTPEQRSALRDLGQQATAQIELRRIVSDLRRAVTDRERAEAALRSALETAGQTATPPPPASTTRPGLLALAALVVPLALTLWGAAAARGHLQRQREERFARRADQIAAAVTERVASYEQLVRGGVALFTASDRVTRREWRNYVASLQIEEKYPGLRALGFITRVPDDQVAAFEARLRADGVLLPVRPLLDHGEHYPVTYVEPAARNTSSLAFDMGSESRRRTALEAARDQGRPVMTAELALVQDTEQAPAFLTFAPVYAHEATLATLADRRSSLEGFVYAAARAGDVVGTLPVALAPELDLEVYDGIAPRREGLLHDSAPPVQPIETPRGVLSRRTTITVSGRPWTLHLTALPAFDADEASREPDIILAGGGLGSLLLFGFVWSLASARRVAMETVEGMTRALRTSEQRVRSVMDTVADAIVTFGRDGKVQTANPAAQWLFGRRLADLVGHDIGALIPGIVAAPVGHVEAEAQRADGTVPVDVAVTPTAGGESFVASVRDVSERREAEKALRQSEQRTRSILDNMLGGLITIDEGANIESMNPAAEAIFGYTAAEVVGRSLAMLVPESVGDRAAHLRSAFARAIGRITEWQGLRKNGEVFPFELSMFEFTTGGGGGRHFAGSVRDSSERHAVEKLKQEFVSTVSHELRTPLTSIRGSLSLLAGGVLGDLSDEAREMVTISERNCVRLIALVNDILDLERLEHGQLQMEIAEVGLSDVLSRAREAVQAFADDRQVSLQMETTTTTVQGDAGRLVQVLVNLVSNAVKFSPAGAAVRVTVRETGGRARVEVIDHGRGVPASHRAAIFERFRQVESSDAREKGGTGLGLAICQAIVEQHGGEIGVESEEGQGSTFWFDLPSAPAADRFLEMFRAADGQPDVLLADHDAALLGVLVRQLVGDGVRVRVAFDADEAEKAIREAAPRLLVMDLGLPEGEGRRLLDHLRAEERLALMPLLVYSAQDVGERLQVALALGPTRFLTKSRATDAEVRALVEQMLGAEAREGQA